MPPKTILLDVTRLASRLGRGALTGIDRVERAYLRHFLEGNFTTLGLLRTAAGLVVLNEAGLRRLEALASGAPFPRHRDLLARLTRRTNPLLGALETDLRRHSVARAPMSLAGPALRRAVPAGSDYLNVGHANLSHQMMRALRRVSGLKITIMVHDTIPLDHPEFTRPGQSEVFARKLAVVSHYADRVIHLANTTRQQTEAQLATLGRVPPGIVAPLDVTPAAPDASALPPGLMPDTPYFVALGTIEPRKNHALLLDVWGQLASRGGEIPALIIVGNRGWADARLMSRIDSGVPGIKVVSGLEDAAVSALLMGARALLFPSFAEGFGLPPREAAALGIPVLCSDLPVLREGLGTYPVYLGSTDSFSWMETILSVYRGKKIESSGKTGTETPLWTQHFKTVLNSL